MSKSILQSEKECFMCGTVLNLERHHVIFGTAGRKISDKLGLTVWLCHEHHQGRFGPHQDRETDLRLRSSLNTAMKINAAGKSGWRKSGGIICEV